MRQRLESDYNVSLRSRRAYLEVAVLKTVRDVQAKTALAQAQLESDDDDADAEEDSAVVSLLGMAKPPEPVDSVYCRTSDFSLSNSLSLSLSLFFLFFSSFCTSRLFSFALSLYFRPKELAR